MSKDLKEREGCGKGVPGRVSSWCKCSEVGVCLAYLKNKKASVEGTESLRETRRKFMQRGSRDYVM